MNEPNEKDKRIQIEKLETELKRSLKVVGVKQAHKQIEDIEKLRRKSAIISVIERINLSLNVNNGVLQGLNNAKKDFSKEFLNEKIPDFSPTELNIITNTFDAVRYDIQQTAEIRNEDFNKLFPKPQLSFESIADIGMSIINVCIQLEDMKAYCQRLV